MELAALYERPVARNLAISLYAAPVGEPALGPVAYPHRPSAAADPFAPLSHHWQDATHITYGVLTAGIFSRRWKLEGSIFNGREPDEHRTGFDYAGRGLDSYSARLTVNPGARWSVSASYGYLKSPEELHPDEAQHRISASVLQVATLGERGELATALIWGANVNSGERSPSNSIVAEATLDLDGTNTLFGRAELVQKSAADLALDDDLALLDPAGAAGTSESEDARRFDVGALAAGYLREIASFPGGSIGVGVLASLDVVPRALEPAYDTRTPGGFAVFLRVRPRRTSTNMGGMRMSARPERPPIETRERGSGRRARSTE